MESTINEIFNALNTRFIEPFGNGLVSLIGPLWIVAFIIAVLGLIFTIGNPQHRGMKIGVVVALAIFGFVWFGYGTAIIQGITGQANVNNSAISTIETGSNNSSNTTAAANNNNSNSNNTNNKSAEDSLKSITKS